VNRFSKATFAIAAFFIFSVCAAIYADALSARSSENFIENASILHVAYNPDNIEKQNGDNGQNIFYGLLKSSGKTIGKTLINNLDTIPPIFIETIVVLVVAS
jgi:hypothetical protein